MLPLRAIFIIQELHGRNLTSHSSVKVVCHKRTKKIMRPKDGLEKSERLPIENEIYHPLRLKRTHRYALLHDYKGREKRPSRQKSR